MITEFLIDVIAGVVTWVGNLIPDMPLPDWWVDVQTTMAGLSRINDFSWFIPVQAIGAAALFLITATAAATLVYTGRTIFSMFTGGGGAT